MLSLSLLIWNELLWDQRPMIYCAASARLSTNPQRLQPKCITPISFFSHIWPSDYDVIAWYGLYNNIWVHFHVWKLWIAFSFPWKEMGLGDSVNESVLFHSWETPASCHSGRDKRSTIGDLWRINRRITGTYLVFLRSKCAHIILLIKWHCDYTTVALEYILLSNL